MCSIFSSSSFPVVLLKFCLRTNSGGQGKYRGGDGVDRQILFRRPMTLSILTERRVHRPYGLRGGENGQCGKNLLKRADGRWVNLGGKSSIPMQPGVSNMKMECKVNDFFRIGFIYLVDTWWWWLRQSR